MPMTAAAAQPLNMALGQLITNEVLDTRLLNAMVAVPRGKCVPAALANSAYVDEELPLGHGRALLAPLTFARMLQLANPRAGDKALIIGCGMGYSVAVLSSLVKRVTGYESEAELAANAAHIIAALELKNAIVEKTASLTTLPSITSPYDIIIIEGAVQQVPANILARLAEGGRLVTILQKADGSGLVQGLSRLALYVNADGHVSHKELQECTAPLLPGYEAPRTFVF